MKKVLLTVIIVLGLAVVSNAGTKTDDAVQKFIQLLLDFTPTVYYYGYELHDCGDIYIQMKHDGWDRTWAMNFTQVCIIGKQDKINGTYRLPKLMEELKKSYGVK